MDVIMVGPWMLSSQNGIDHGLHGCSLLKNDLDHGRHVIPAWMLSTQNA